MMNVPTGNRREIKLLVPAAKRSAFEVWLRTAPVLFHRTYADRIVNTAYFDTLDYRDYSANVDGLSRRSKMRLRWYGSHAAPEAMQVEEKIRHSQIGTKRVWPVQPFNLESLRWDGLRETLLKRVSPDCAGAMGDFRNPVSRNRYVRRYYESRDNSLRLTVDTKLQLFDVCAGSRIGEGYAKMATFDIVEAKIASGQLEDISRIFATFPTRVSRLSKYVLGVQLWRM
jgi:hypothetical protein